MPIINAEYKSELSVNKLYMDAGTYTLNKQGENNIKYGVDVELDSYTDTSGTLLTDEIEITVSSYITFVSDKGYMILNISTNDTGVVFKPVVTDGEWQAEKISGNNTQLTDLTSAWTVWTPTLTWTGATPTTIDVDARYKILGKTLIAQVKVTAADGNGATNLQVDSPVTLNNGTVNMIAPTLVIVGSGISTRTLSIADTYFKFSYMGTATSGQALQIYIDIISEIA